MRDIAYVKLSFNISYVMVSSLLNKLFGFECGNECGAQCGAISGATFTRQKKSKVCLCVTKIYFHVSFCHLLINIKGCSLYTFSRFHICCELVIY